MVLVNQASENETTFWVPLKNVKNVKWIPIVLGNCTFCILYTISIFQIIKQCFSH